MNFIIFGQMGSGKDTVAKTLQYLIEIEYLKERVKIIKLGSKIRQDVDKISMFHAPVTNRRILYQEYGQSMRSIFGDDIWCNYADKEIQDSKTFTSFVIADGRQQNELEYFKLRGLIPIGIKCDEEVRKERLLKRDDYVNEGFEHETEKSALNIINQIEKSGGYIIDNNKTKSEVFKDLELIVKNVKK